MSTYSMVTMLVMAGTAVVGQPNGHIDSWTDQAVLSRKPVTNLRLPVKVIEELAGRLRLMDGDGMAWVPKADYVPMSEAITYFATRVNSNPRDVWALYMRSIAEHENGQVKEAIESINKCIALGAPEARMFCTRGDFWYEMKVYSNAIKDYTDAIRIDADFALAHHNRGMAFAETSDFVQAIRDFDNSIRLGPKVVGMFNNRGHAWMQLGAYDKAIPDFDTAIQLNPRIAPIHYNRGLSYARMGGGILESCVLAEEKKAAYPAGD